MKQFICTIITLAFLFSNLNAAPLVRKNIDSNKEKKLVQLSTKSKSQNRKIKGGAGALSLLITAAIGYFLYDKLKKDDE